MIDFVTQTASLLKPWLLGYLTPGELECVSLLRLLNSQGCCYCGYQKVKTFESPKLNLVRKLQQL